MENLSDSKMRVLLFLNNEEKNQHTITKLSTALDMSKANISKSVSWCIERGMIVKEGIHTLNLTYYGSKIAQKYNQRRKEWMTWLDTENTPRDMIEEISVDMALHCSENVQQIISRLASEAKMLQYLKKHSEIKGSKIRKYLGEESMSAAFCFSQGGEESRGSILERSLESSGKVIVSNGKSWIVIREKLGWKPDLILPRFFCDGTGETKDIIYDMESMYLEMDDLVFSHIKKRKVLFSTIQVFFSKEDLFNSKICKQNIHIFL